MEINVPKSDGGKIMVGFNVDFYWYEVGSGDFLHSFFSTVAVNLENGKWGSRFPVIMNELYQGKISSRKVEKAIKEVETIKSELKNYPPSKVVWDIEYLSKLPPWGDDIDEEITDLSNYFVTSDGEDFIEVFMQALNQAKEMKKPIEIDSM